MKLYVWPVPCIALEDAFTQQDARRRRMWSGFSLDLEDAHTPDTSNMLRNDYGALAVRGHLLPIRPLWGALALNTAFYAIPWFLLLLGGVALFRHRGSGCCVACGYDLSGLPTGVVCPECGHSSYTSM